MFSWVDGLVIFMMLLVFPTVTMIIGNLKYQYIPQIKREQLDEVNLIKTLTREYERT